MAKSMTGKHCFEAKQRLVTIILLGFSLFVNQAVSQRPSADLLFNVVEEQSVGTYIGTITDNQFLYKNLTTSQRKQLRYGLLDQNRYPASLFRVDESSGAIYVANRLDRESEECYRKDSCRLEFNVAISSPRIPFSNIATVRVVVQDKNDNPPYFPAQESGSIVLELSELTPVGTVLKLSGAVDRDHDHNNTVKRYALTAYTSVFSISSSSNLDGSSVLDLTLLQPLDREAISAYPFSILAFDGGSPPLSAALAVQIRVTDENDNPPVFRNATYSVDIRDEVQPGQVIVQVSAGDRDQGENGQVRYQFSSLQRQQLEQTFQVDEATGKVSVVSELTAGVHQFIVEALDGGSPPLKSQTVVKVTVVSSRNNPPLLQINTLSNGSNLVQVFEDAGLGAFVAFVTAEDRDDGARGDISCRLNSNTFRLDTLPGKGYTLTLNGALDREKQDSYNVTVTCSDRGQPPLSSVEWLQVVVMDVNDNPPHFTWSTFSHTVPEGNYSNRHVIQVTATDADVGKNAELVYSIDSSAQPPFRIDPDSGIISASGHLDRESKPVYSFQVHAADKGLDSNTATATVIITLQDENDQYPTFNQTIFEFRIPEDAPDGTALGKLVAYDKDEGQNAEFSFFFAGSLDGVDPFVVGTNGSLWTKGELDRERRDSYSFTVMVRDKGVPPKTTYASVVVTILDVNDNAPRIQFPVASNHTIHVSSTPEAGMVLAKIVAYDPDAAENGSLHFVILLGNEDGALDIDSSGGEVKVRDVSRMRNKRVYRLVVGVQDYGLPSRRTNTTVFIDVNFDNSSGLLSRGGQEGQTKADDYVLIVAGVAGTTVVLSAFIIVAICFIFRQDRQFRGKHPTGNTQPGIGEDGEYFSPAMPHHDNLCDDEKLRPSLEEEGDEKNAEHTTSFNDEIYEDDDDDSGFKAKQIAMETFRHSQRKKEVSFASSVPVAEESGPVDMGSPVSHTYRNTNFGMAGPGENVMRHHHHQLLARQIDEVGSDTSGDTGTSDSGRGGSEDDVNIDHILHGEAERAGDGHPMSHHHVDNERYTKFPPPRAPKGDHSKPYHVRFDTRHCDSPTNHRAATPSHDPHSTNKKTVSFLPSVRSNTGSTLFSPRTNRDGSFSSQAYRDVSFTPLPQHGSPQRTLSTFSSDVRAPASFSTFHKSGSSSQQQGASGEDDASTTTSGSYTLNPDELRMDGYIGSDVIV